ncbi:kinesin-like protein KIN-12B [Durio zibethinus]|uniref:Kinesin-like protein KIN-12B n=1 Tax=Durio zibethinus TaxID=66656 RepID=A0A6P5X2S3_DURZI|nr:kinesin-like protein KIN-12B [Durio zibethinus]
MKHFMLPRNTVLREQMENPSSPNLTPSKSKRKHQKSSKENAPPPDPNSQPSPAATATAKIKCPLPPRPPSSNPLKRKLYPETLPENAVSGISDSGVKVVVRMRPPIKEEEEGETIVQKISNESLSITGQTFTFDSVANTDATQLDIFQLVGAPLVENCLAGFNSSVFAYGQTGSGKTYTIWGPANALLEENLSSDQQGLTPRVFDRLFARINEEQIKHADKQLKYQCRCSFLEIYNEQITDLLDPNQRNLQIREDVKSGVYVENLTEEYVSSMKDVTQLLIKGLSNRRTGATTINAESSRSHCVFTCVVESRCKSVADGVSSFKTSRINLVDLAGSERQKLTGAAGDRLKEAGNINRSLSQLGNLINILAEVSQTGKQRHIPYRDSKLTFLLQESLGGNAKLAMVCAISPAQSCKSETFSTLRFAQRTKAIKNKAVINEVMQDDVNFLREVIRQLKDELQRMKANGNNQTDPNGSYSTGWNARRSLNLLKFSLNHPRTLPHIDEDGDEEMEIDEEAVESLCAQVGLQSADIYRCSNEVTKPEIIESDSGNTTSENGCAHDLLPNTFECVKAQDTEDTDVNMEEEISEETKTSEIMIVGSVEPATNMPNVVDAHESVKENPGGPGQLTVETTDGDSSVILKSPTPSVSPRVNQSRKSLRTSSMFTASQKDLKDDGPEAMRVPFTPTEHLAASLHRGLEIIDSHHRSLALRRSPFRFSLKPADSKPILAAHKVDAGVQTFLPDYEIQEEEPVAFLCGNCKKRTNMEGKEDNESSNMQLVPVDESESAEKTKKQVPKAVEKVLAGSIRREMALEDFCAKQASEIMQLNRLVQQYKHERECNAIIGQTREDKILRLESLMDGVLPTEEFMEEELASLTHEHKLLKEKYENHPEVLRTKIELKRVQDELERFRNFHDFGEREVLLEEIQDLRNQLQYYIDSSSTSARRQNSLLQLTYSCEPNMPPPLSAIPETNEESTEEKFEQERIRWTEAESKWISLVEELRTELDASQLLAEKRKQELDMEKKCAEELKEAMQMAMVGHATMLEQYADLEEKHMQLLARHRKIQEGIDDVKKAAARAGVRGAESKFINALAAEISALKVEREKERQYLRDENRGLQAQLRDTAEAVQAAGELLVRLKEAEEAVAAAQKRAMETEQETEKARRQIDKLKRKHEHEISTLNELLTESRLPKKAIQPAYDNFDIARYDAGEIRDACDQQWREEFEPFYKGEDGELSKLAENSSWFSGYDRCNI